MENNSFLLPSEVEFNPLSSKFYNDPFSDYKVLHAKAPIFFMRGLHGREWIVTKYDDVVSALNNQHLIKFDVVSDIREKARFSEQGRGFNSLAALIDNWLFFMEPPRHGNIRRLLTHWFKPARIEAVAPFIDQTINELIITTKAQGAFNVLDDFSAVVAFKAMCYVLDCESLRSPEILQCAIDMFRIVNPPISIKEFKKMDAAATYFIDSIQKLLTENKSEDGFIGCLQKAQRHGELTELEIIGCISMLLSVGQDTTKHLIGNSLHALFSNQEQLTLLKSKPELLEAAIYECGRYNAPVSMLPRLAMVDTSIGGVDIMAGERVFLFIAAACRDKDKFASPDELDIERGRKNSLFYGAGIHFCLGSQLAHVITGKVISRLLKEDTLRLNFSEANWINFPGMHGLDNLRGYWS